MVATLNRSDHPFRLVVTGEAEDWLPALERIVGPQWLVGQKVQGDRELLRVVESRDADAAVLDDQADWELDVLQVLRMIRRVDSMIPVVVISTRHDRRWLEDALRLAAFSVVTRPLELEELLRQVHRMMAWLDRVLRGEQW